MVWLKMKKDDLLGCERMLTGLEMIVIIIILLKTFIIWLMAREHVLIMII